MLPLVPETPQIASKNGLGPQPSKYTVVLEVLFPAGFWQASRWQKEPQCALDAILSLKLSATSEFLFPTCLAVFHVYSFLLLSDDSLFRPLQMVTAAMKLKDAYSLEGKL